MAKEINIDCHVISYPKSGRTWLRVMMGKALCDLYEFDERKCLDIYTLTSQAGLRRTVFQHDMERAHHTVQFDEISVDKTSYQGKRVVFIVREVKDVLVSCYFQYTKRDIRYKGDISGFIRDPRLGLLKILTYNNIWYLAKNVPEDFLLIHYEDLHENPGDALRGALRVIGLPDVEDGVIEKAVEFAAFENMRNMEKNHFFESIIMRPGDVGDDESFKTRKGITGGYVNYLSQEDIDWIDETTRAVGCPFLGVPAAWDNVDG